MRTLKQVLVKKLESQISSQCTKRDAKNILDAWLKDEYFDISPFGIDVEFCKLEERGITAYFAIYIYERNSVIIPIMPMLNGFYGFKLINSKLSKPVSCSWLVMNIHEYEFTTMTPEKFEYAINEFRSFSNLDDAFLYALQFENDVLLPDIGIDCEEFAQMLIDSGNGLFDVNLMYEKIIRKNIEERDKKVDICNEALLNGQTGFEDYQ